MIIPKNFAELSEQSRIEMLAQRGYSPEQVRTALEISNEGYIFIEDFRSYKKLEQKGFKDYCTSRGFKREHSKDIRRIAFSSIREEGDMDCDLMCLNLSLLLSII